MQRGSLPTPTPVTSTAPTIIVNVPSSHSGIDAGTAAILAAVIATGSALAVRSLEHW
jgi:hypothetical protein